MTNGNSLMDLLEEIEATGKGQRRLPNAICVTLHRAAAHCIEGNGGRFKLPIIRHDPTEADVEAAELLKSLAH
jgi:hypothetical protein